MPLSEALLSDSVAHLGSMGSELVALDLTRDPSWCGEELAGSGSGSGGWDGRARTHGSDGYLSPMGFYFRVATVADTNAAMRLSVRQPSDQSAIDRATVRLRESGPVRVVELEYPEPSEGELTLVVGPSGAEVFADDEAWATLAEPVVLYVAQYARYCAVERQFLELQVKARRDHRHAVAAGLGSLRMRRRLLDTSLAVRAKVSDWTYFTGPTSDARRWCSSEAALKACASLEEALDMEAWGKAIDQLVVDVEQTYETISDKLFHYQLFLWGASLEVVVVGLIVELLLR